MGELATVRYGIKSDGKIKVESKDESKGLDTNSMIMKRSHEEIAFKHLTR